jgi:hypothetical protein
VISSLVVGLSGAREEVVVRVVVILPRVSFLVRSRMIHDLQLLPLCCLELPPALVPKYADISGVLRPRDSVSPSQR